MKIINSTFFVIILSFSICTVIFSQFKSKAKETVKLVASLMKKRGFLLIILTIAFLLSPSSYCQKKFEGEVVFSLTNMGETSTLDYFVKGNNVRVDMKSSMSQLTSIFNRSNNRMYMLMPSAKMYIVSPLNMPGKTKNNIDKNRPKMEKTNEKKIIKGYNCVKWIIRDKSGIADAWMTNEIGRYTAMGSSSGEKSDNDWQEQMEESGNFPMLVVQKNKKGKETSRLEVKSVNKKNIKDSLFKVPDGYKEMLTGSGQ